MDWMKRMEDVLDYIEENLTETIDFNEIARLACISSYNFQRIFSYCMEYPLAEYIRNRRMSLAAEELRNSDIGILDLAVKYGYNSQEAFSRAFYKFHGVTPKQARTMQVILKFCPKAKLVYKEETKQMNEEESSYFLNRKPTGERFKNKAPSPITMNFPVSMWSYMEYIGQNTNTMQNYTLIANLCGDTYNSGLALTSDQGIKVAMNAFGYECEIYSTRECDKNYLNEAQMTVRIRKELSLNQRPCIAINVVDCCFGGVIAGYKEDGKCLLNWGYFPFDFSENPQPVITECRDWYEKTQKVIFVKESSNWNFDLKKVYSYALKCAADYLGDPSHLVTSLFYEEWRQRLIENEPLIKNDFSLIDPMWCDYAEKRFYAGQMMLQLKLFFPEYGKEFDELWDIFGQRINHLMYDYIAQVDLAAGEEIETINLEKLNRKEVRTKMCEIVSRCEEEEKRAASLLQSLVK